MIISLFVCVRVVQKPETSGKGWYNMRVPRMTAERKRQYKIIQMRGALDPKRHYKRMSNKIPSFFQVQQQQQLSTSSNEGARAHTHNNNNSTAHVERSTLHVYVNVDG